MSVYYEIHYNDDGSAIYKVNDKLSLKYDLNARVNAWIAQIYDGEFEEVLTEFLEDHKNYKGTVIFEGLNDGFAQKGFIERVK